MHNEQYSSNAIGNANTSMLQNQNSVLEIASICQFKKKMGECHCYDFVVVIKRKEKEKE